MKSALFTIFIFFAFTVNSFAQETKVYIKSNTELGRFYAYVDGILINRAPQLQVGILDLDEKPSYKVKIVFQNPEKMPIEGEIKPKKNYTRLFVLYAGSGDEVKARKGDKDKKEAPLSGDITPSHPFMREYTGRLGCDSPIGDEVVNQIISQMTSFQPTTPLEIAKKEVTVMCFTVAQFRRMLEVLDTDAERVELSKVAWYYLYDQENFDHLENAFTEPGQVQLVLDFVKQNQ